MTTTTRAEITVTDGRVTARVYTPIKQELIRDIIAHLLDVATDVDFDSNWKLLNIFFYEEKKRGKL